jgi:hypothetical protein
MVRACGIGIGVSLVPKERNVVVANNVIAGSRIGAVVGTEYGKTITGVRGTYGMAELDFFRWTVGDAAPEILPRSVENPQGYFYFNTISGDIPNITQFYLLGHADHPAAPSNLRTALVVDLPDRPGSLCRFLTPLSEAAINLKRLESRPLRGRPNQYRFFVEIEGSPAVPAVADGRGAHGRAA